MATRPSPESKIRSAEFLKTLPLEVDKIKKELIPDRIERRVLSRRKTDKWPQKT